jgi:Acetyltransferase (GNAT) domain
MSKIMELFHRWVEKAGAALRFLRLYGQHLPLAYDAIFTLACVVRTLEGTLQGTDERLSVLYAGRGKNFTYLKRAIFGECEVAAERKASLFSVEKHIAKLATSVDVVLVDVGWPYHGRINRDKEYLEVPDWVTMAIDLPETWQGVIQSFRHTTRNNDLRLIRRNQYQCRPTRSRADLQEFYESFYLPFVHAKHADDVVLSPRRHVMKRGQQGTLLQITRGDDIVAAGVVYPEGETMYFLWMGLPTRHLRSPPEACISALYYFGIRYAFDHGFKRVDFTGNRALLNDGAFRFKRKWGANVEDSFSPSSILVKPREGSRKAAVFCQNVPVLVRGTNGLEARFLFADGDATPAAVARIARDYGCEGIARTTVIEVGLESETGAMPTGEETCQYLPLRTNLEGFVKSYLTP